MISKAPKETRNNLTILVIAGWGTIVPSWKGFLHEAKRDFDIIYLETREKLSSVLPKNLERCSMDRLSSDLAEVVKQLKLGVV